MTPSNRSYRPPSGGLGACPARGFTLVELVMVITIVAVIASVGMSRFASPSPFAGRALADQLASSLRAAQRLAVAQRQVLYVQVVANPAAVLICRDLACAQAVTPVDGSAAWLTAAAGARLDTGAAYSIDGMGRPSLAAAQTFTPLDEAGQPSGPVVRVEAETGFARVLTP